MEGKIYEAISNVMGDINAVGKNQVNQQQRFRYRGIDDVMNALQPALVKNKVFCVPEILEQTREDRESAKGAKLIYSVCKIKYTFFTTDGSSVSCTVIGEGMDSGDKATNKAMSIAFKYACFQVFCIPTEEMRQSDPDREDPMQQGVQKLDEKYANAIFFELQRTGVGLGGLLKNFGVSDIHDLTMEQFKQAMDCLQKKPDKAKE